MRRVSDHPSDPDPAGKADPEDIQSCDDANLGAVPPAEEGAPVAPSVDTDEPVAEEVPDPPDEEGKPDPLTVATAERDDYLDQLMRARADYDNLNKRRHREVAEARDRGASQLAGDLIEVLDNFGFALRAAETSEDESLAKGVRLVHDQLVDVLQRSGLEQVPGVGAPFDPAHHEALMSEADDTDREHPEVGEVLRTGYRYKAVLLRPASVKVLE